MSPRSWAAPVLALLLVVPGCRPATGGREPSSVVATIDGVPVPLSAFENYLAVHFVEDGLEEPLTSDDRDRVLSRLFDDFLAESLLVVESDRRGVRVEDAEIAAWLGEDTDPDPTREAARKEQARRELATRRLVDAWLRAESKARGGKPPEPSEESGAADRLVKSLRSRYAVRLHVSALPFRYGAESPGAGQPAGRPASPGP